MYKKKIIAVESGSIVIVDRKIIRNIRGPFFSHLDKRLIAFVILSVCFHCIGMFFLGRKKVKTEEHVVIEQVPERFARLIIEKPIVKSDAADITEIPKKNTKQASEFGNSAKGRSTKSENEIKKSVTTSIAKVEKNVRTVGALGMLTGVGHTAKGPSVIDVLGATGGKEKFTDLDNALEKVSGLKQAKNMDVLDRKLIQSKDVTIDQKQEIDDLIAGIGTSTTSSELMKRGDFVIQMPQSIEGAASSNTKRDHKAINEKVATHKMSIRLSYEKYLKRNPQLAGKISVRFTIAPEGNVKQVIVIENSTGSRELEQDIVRKVTTWHFDPIPEGDVTVTYPFVFVPA